MITLAAGITLLDVGYAVLFKDHFSPSLRINSGTLTTEYYLLSRPWRTVSSEKGPDLRWTNARYSGLLKLFLQTLHKDKEKPVPLPSHAFRFQFASLALFCVLLTLVINRGLRAVNVGSSLLSVVI